MRKSLLFFITLFFILATMSGSGLALSVISPIQPADGGAEFSSFYSPGSEIEYDIEYDTDDSDTLIKRDIVGLSFASGGDTLNIFCSLGFIFNSKFHADTGNRSLNLLLHESDIDDGYLFVVGARSMVADLDFVKIHGYGQITYVYEEWSLDDLSRGYELEADMTSYEISLGVAGEYSFSESVFVYGALEIAPFSDGDGDITLEESGSNPTTVDIDKTERDNMFCYKAGCVFRLDRFFIRGDAFAGGEEGISLNIGITY